MFGKSKGKAVTHSEKGFTVAMSETAPCERSLEVTVSPEAFVPIREAVAKEFQRESSLRGFRKGKAPMQLVEQRYADSIRQESLERATRQAFQQAARAHELRPVGPFEIHNSQYDESSGLKLEARVDVEPQFELGEYKALPLKREPIAIGDEEKAQALTQLQESMARMAPSAEDPEKKERQVPAMDDELAKDIGFESLDALKAQVERHLRGQKEQAREEAVRAQLYNALIERHTFDVPPRLVEHQRERLSQDLRTRLLMGGVEEAKADEQLAKMEEQTKASAERQVKLGFILERIAEAEAIEVTNEDLAFQIWQLSQRWRKDPREVRTILEKERLWPSVINSIRQDKVTAWLLQSAAVEGEPYPQPQAAEAHEHAHEHEHAHAHEAEGEAHAHPPAEAPAEKKAGESAAQS